MGRITETGAYFSQPPSPSISVLGGVVWENLVGTSDLGFRNNIEMGQRGAEGDFHNGVLLGVKCGSSRLLVAGTVGHADVTALT